MIPELFKFDFLHNISLSNHYTSSYLELHALHDVALDASDFSKTRLAELRYPLLLRHLGYWLLFLLFDLFAYIRVVIIIIIGCVVGIERRGDGIVRLR